MKKSDFISTQKVQDQDTFSSVKHVVCRKHVWEITSLKTAYVKVKTLQAEVGGKKHQRIPSNSQRFATVLLDAAQSPGHFISLHTSSAKGNTETKTPDTEGKI